MKNYNVPNYIRYREDLRDVLSRVDLNSRERDDVIIQYMPLAENIAKRFPTGVQAIGTLSINDLIQEGLGGLVSAVDKIDWEVIDLSTDPEKTLKAFLSKRIKGAIRRGIDKYRGNIKIPEHKLAQIRKSDNKDDKIVQMFFNSIFLSIDDKPASFEDDDSYNFQIEDKSEPYNIAILNTYLMGLMKQHLKGHEYEVLRRSYGLDCEKQTALEIAKALEITVDTAQVRVSQIKRSAVNTLVERTDRSQVLDFL